MLKDYALKLLKKSLEIDVGFGDITSSILPKVNVEAVIVAKEECLLCGINFIEEFFNSYGIKTKKLANDGDLVNGEILILNGDAETILTLERTALNFLSHLSGVATYTYRIIKIAKEVNKKVKIACTRKTLPLLSPLQKYAVYIAGGDTHRFRLDDCILIKDNHIDIMGIKEAIRKAKKNASFTKKIEVEVRNLEELKLALEEKPDIIMLDNFSTDMVGKALKIINEFKEKNKFKPIIEVSGGINEKNIKEYAKYDVDVISIGALTHSAKSIDMSLKIKRK
ncbi:nicotinate-nucleotide pyrophosphorylase [Methanocaldococcus villosus KIN24-T80]|uniref:Nicotinate-nucleotide pyrophosphorylase [carboxylating] n=1 Tax=Methanocaldococcus villosus KIN24-T80 TaxID=1069083 RepID=N6UU18_9EURY|nr:carboxylating nicotinate-nucleotide diphosphorylase [Methanocaldococcus villosus]ENN95849.1 nicotinate-nucleotide pyrophosphorylase [Methanocaldococcus villosus KIN24-T80]